MDGWTAGNVEMWAAQRRKLLGLLAQIVLLVAFSPFVYKPLYLHLKTRMVRAQEVPRKSQPCQWCTSLHAQGRAFTLSLAPDSKVGRPGFLMPS